MEALSGPAIASACGRLLEDEQLGGHDEVAQRQEETAEGEP